MTQHEATEKAKRLFGSRAFTYVNWSAKPPEFCVGTLAVHTSQGNSPLRGKTWEEAFEKFEGKIDLTGIKVRKDRADDPEGAMDTAFDRARQALDKL